MTGAKAVIAKLLKKYLEITAGKHSIGYKTGCTGNIT
jgi:hypothetical protein